MVKTILDFVNLLRKAGLRISPAEIEDCLKAVELIGFSQKDFKATLQTTLVKESKDIKTFEKLFHLYFSCIDEKISKKTAVNNQIIPTQKKASSHDGKGLGRSGAGGPTPDLLQVLSSQNESLLDSIAQTAIETLGDFNLDSVELIWNKIREAQVNLKWFMTIYKLEKLLEEKKIDYLTYQKYMEKMNKLQEKIEVNIKKFLISKYGDLALEKIAQSENISETDFVKLNATAVEQLKQKVNQLGRRLASKKSYRYMPSSSGKIYIKRVLKKSMKYGGVPLELPYARRKIARPEIILICDISQSVAQFSSFMLQLVYISQNSFKDVQSFVFVDHLSNVTNLFKKLDLEEALQEIKYLAGVSETGYSHFGQTFFEFYTNYSSIVNDRSTVIILGDAKNNWRPSGVEYLKKISSKCRKLYWLNPQAKDEWDKKDSIMSIYAPWCSGVYECRNMNQLERVVKKIF